MKVTTCIESPHKAVDFFASQLQEFKPIKKLTSFFDSENFLLTNYNPSNASIHTIIENNQGDIIEFSSLNCGYVGVGPNATAQVLQSIGLDETLVSSLTRYSGIQIDFEKYSAFGESSIDTNAFFNGRTSKADFHGCNLNNYTVADILSHDVYMINPEIHNFTGLLNCLHVMKPIEFEFIMSENSYLMAYEEAFGAFKEMSVCKPLDTNGVNLIIRGEKFDLKCFVSRKLFQGTINAIYTYLMKRSLFEEYSVGGTYVYAKSKSSSTYAWWRTLLLLFQHHKTIHHQILDVNDKELKHYGN